MSQNVLCTQRLLSRIRHYIQYDFIILVKYIRNLAKIVFSVLFFVLFSCFNYDENSVHLKSRLLASPWMDARKTPSKIDLYDVRRRPW